MRTKLLFIVAATGAPFFAVVHHNESIEALPVMQDADINVIDEDNQSAAYGAFIGHIYDKHSHISLTSDVRDRWYDWASQNLDENGRLKDQLFIPQTGVLSYDSWINLGVDKERSNQLWETVAAIITTTPEEDRHTSTIISQASQYAKNHAELVILASNATIQMHSYRKELREEQKATDALIKEEIANESEVDKVASLKDIEQAQSQFEG